MKKENLALDVSLRGACVTFNFFYNGLFANADPKFTQKVQLSKSRQTFDTHILETYRLHSDGSTIKWHVASTEYGEAYFSALMQSQTKDWVTEGARRSPFSRSYLRLAAPGDEASPKNASVGPSNERSRYPVRWAVRGLGIARGVGEGNGEGGAAD